VSTDPLQDTTALLSAAELARALGLSATTINNWTKLHSHPLQTVVTSDGHLRFTWSHLHEFCRAHPSLRGVAKIQQQPPHAEQIPLGQTTTPDSQIEGLKALARDLRNAASSNLQAALEAARRAEETAQSHRRELEHLATTMAAYDSALTSLTAPATMNDLRARAARTS
jgi:hypothetical protein